MVGEIVIGRNPECQICITDDAQVSRRHAVLRVTKSGVTIEDLGSANGIYVDDDRVAGSRALSGGERIRIGAHQLRLTSGAGPERDAEAPSADDHKLKTTVSSEDDSARTSSEVFGLLGNVIDKALSLGDLEEAERILRPVVKMLRDEAARDGTLDHSAAEQAAVYAIKVAVATRSGRFIDALIDLYAIVRRPMPTPLIDELYRVIRQVDRVDVLLLREYADDLRSRAHQFLPAERFAVSRIDGLEKLASLK